MPFRLLFPPSLLLLLCLCLAPGTDVRAADEFPPYDNTKAAEAYYKSKPDFFHFKSPAELPKDLKWTSGDANLPEMGDPAATKGGTVNFFVAAFPPSLRVFGPDANSSFRSEHWDDIYIMPVSYHGNDTTKTFPGLASSWALADDNRTVYYRINPKATFSNGDTILTDDFFMVFYIMQSPHIDDPWYNNFYNTKYSSITRYDERTFSVQLAEPRADPVYWTQLQPLNVRFYREFGPDFPKRYQWRKAPTTGAYDIDVSKMIKGQRIIMHRVKNWWLRDVPQYRYRFNPDYIVYDSILNADKAFETFRKGKLSFFYLDSPRYWYDKMDIPEFHQGYIQKATFYTDYPRPPWGVYINSAKPLLDDINVRRGIQHSMNIQKLIDAELRGDFTQLRSTAEGYGPFTNTELRPPEFSPEKAVSFFEKAGFKQTGRDGIRLNDAGTRLSFKLLIRDMPTHRRYGLRLKEEAVKAGLELVLVPMDNTSAFKVLREKNHELTITAWASSPPYPRYWEGFHSDNAFEKKDGKVVMENGRPKTKPNTNNITSTSNPELDKVIDQYEKAASNEELARLAHRAEELIREEACFVPGWMAPYHRTGYWRWIRWPRDFNVKVSEFATTNHVLWVDEKLQKETLDAMKAGQAFDPVEKVYDQYR